MNNEFDHSPVASLDYGFDYTNWLDAGETITASTWEATVGVTLSGDVISSGVTSVFASGGVINGIYYLTNTITTSTTPPRADSRTLILLCKRR